MRWLCLFMIIALCSCEAFAQNAEQRYMRTYMLLGFLVRSAAVCSDINSKERIDFAFRLVGTKELRMISRAYKQKTEEWMLEGSKSFNSSVMQYGATRACENASEWEEVIKSNNAQQTR